MAVMFGQYSRLQRRLKTLQHLAEPVGSGLRGIVQGCAISVVFCNCVTVLWYELQRQGTTLPKQVSTLLAADPQWPSNHREPDETTVVQTADDQSTLEGFATFM